MIVLVDLSEGTMEMEVGEGKRRLEIEKYGNVASVYEANKTQNSSKEVLLPCYPPS
jgi:hypothetical protein